MRILVTNDDGIAAPGLDVAEAIAAEIAGPDGEVWVVAPAVEQSGVGHAVTYGRPVTVARVGERRYTTDGTPADCVMAGLHAAMTEDGPPDLILSGVNRGNNAAENTLYSGTVGGAMEGALQGVPSIALSQYYGPGNKGLDDPFEAARARGAETVRRIWEHGDWGEAGERFYNVNFPPCAAADVRGLRAATQGRRRDYAMRIEAQDSPNGRTFHWIRGGDQQKPTAEGSDAAMNLEGWISVVPCRLDLTVHEAMDALRGAIEQPS